MIWSQENYQIHVEIYIKKTILLINYSDIYWQDITLLFLSVFIEEKLSSMTTEGLQLEMKKKKR